jgi:hypothetical protein
MTIQLTAEELARVAPFFLECDARTAGFQQGMEAAKQILVSQILKERETKQHDSDQPAATQHAPGAAPAASEPGGQQSADESYGDALSNGRRGSTHGAQPNG